MLDANANTYDLPPFVDSLDAVPSKLTSCYEMATYRDGWARNKVGTVLSKLREGATELGLPSLAANGKGPTLSRADWSKLIAVASPAERKHLLAAKARDEVMLRD